MKPTPAQKPNFSPDKPLFVELSAEESTQIRGAYYGSGYYTPASTYEPNYEPSFYYRPNPYPQYHYTYYNVANPAYLLS
jgi:hypothetical protein